MGVIIRQSLKRSLVSYVGVGIGAISTLFIYPLDLDAYGLAQFILSMAALLTPFAGLGVNTLVVRFFPIFRDPGSRHHGFLTLLILYALTAFALFSVLVFLLGNPFLRLLDFLHFDADLFRDNFVFIILICFFLIFNAIFEAFASNFNRIVVPSIFTNLLQKLLLPVFLLLLVYGSLSSVGFRWALVSISGLGFLGMIWYLKRLKEWQVHFEPSFVSRSQARQMGTYAFFGILSSLTGILPFRIDTIMIATMVNTKENGVYSIANFIVNTVEIPYLAIVAISAPIIAAAFGRRDMDEIAVLYRKASLNLLIAGLLVFLLVWVSVDDLLRLTPRYEELSPGITVILILGLTKALSMSLGLSSYIIDLSPFFRFNFFNLLGIGILNIVLNFFLIPVYQIRGAAIATAVSLLILNILAVGFTHLRLKIHPFTWRTFFVLGLAGLVYLFSLVIPGTSVPMVNILLNSAFVVLGFVIPLLFFDISPDLTGVYLRLRERIKLR